MHDIESIKTVMGLTRIPCYIFWKDTNLIYQGGNDHFLKAIGLKSVNELIGKSDYDLPWAADAESYRETDLVVLQGKSFLSKELRYNVNGPRQLLINKLPMKDENEQIVGILGIHQDVTEYVTPNNEEQNSALHLHLTENILLKENEDELFATLSNHSDSLLTHREIECLSLWLGGHSIKESSYCLNLSHKSIEAYRKNIKDKMQVHHRYQLIELMQAKGIFHLFLSLAKIIQQKSKKIPQSF